MKKINFLRNIPNFNETEKLFHVTKGPEFNLLSDKSIKIIENNKFKLSNRMSRTGAQIEGEKLELKNGKSDIISDGVSAGTIQLPKDGNMYVLLEDSQRIGGYARILNFDTLSLWKITQLKPGDEFKLKIIEKAYKKQELNILLELYLQIYDKITDESQKKYLKKIEKKLEKFNYKSYIMENLSNKLPPLDLYNNYEKKLEQWQIDVIDNMKNNNSIIVAKNVYNETPNNSSNFTPWPKTCQSRQKYKFNPNPIKHYRKQHFNIK